jgi:hypothetical protein
MSKKNEIISGDMLKLLIGGGVLACFMFVLWQISSTATAIILFELPGLAGILLAGLAIGWLPSKFLGKELPVAQKIITALACGLPMLSLGVMGLGLAGLIHLRYLWLGMVGLPAVIGLIVLYRLYQNAPAEEKPAFEAGKYWPVLLLAIVPFLIIILLCATIPPGVLWPAEGFGYDVLEYHLQAPKEWFQAGKIEFLEHNIYANFPANAEMLYLLAMILKNDPHEAVYLAQLVHVSFTILFVAAIWIFTRPYGRKLATFATLTAGTCGWLAYLGPMAYVEMGMLFTGVVAMGLVWRLTQSTEAILSPVRYGVLVGLILGLSAGFKYTALPMIAAPIILMALVVFLKRTKFLKAVLATFLMGVVCVAALCPYLVRNFAWSGNPVFPLAYEQFGGQGWDDALAERWKAGHSPRPDEKPIQARLKKLYWAGFQNIFVNSFIAEYYKGRGEFPKAREIVTPPPIMDLPRFGLAILILPFLIFFTRQQKGSDWLLLFVFLVQTLVWLFATHLQARFLVPWLIVLPFLAGRSAEAFGWGRFYLGIILITGIALLAAGINFADTYRRYYDQTHVQGQQIDWFGRHMLFVKGEVPGTEYLKIINETPSARTLLIGDARPFYIKGPVTYWTVFNRNDFARAFEKPRYEAVKYMPTIKPDFIYVDWGEIKRLSMTYGFDESIAPRLFNVLSRPGEYRVRRLEHWMPFLEYHDQKCPARVLYEVRWKSDEKKGTDKKQSGTSEPVDDSTKNARPGVDRALPLPDLNLKALKALTE